MRQALGKGLASCFEHVVEGIELVGYYKLNSNFRTYLSYYINQLDEKKDVVDGKVKVVQGEDTLRLGVRYDF